MYLLKYQIYILKNIFIFSFFYSFLLKKIARADARAKRALFLFLLIKEFLGNKNEKTFRVN